MAAKRVLGNDPFKRGAAPRVPVATKPVLTPLERRPQTPELQTRRDGKPRPQGPTEVGPVGTGADPVPHAGVPSAVGLDARAAHHHEPSLGADPVPHAAVPRAVGLHAPTPHHHTPSLGADPVSHAAVPRAVGLHAPTPHHHTPSLGADPVSHAAVPRGVGLGTEPAAHHHVPTIGADPVRHAGIPTAVGLSGAPAPHPASPGTDTDPIRHSQAPRGFALESAGPLAHPATPSGTPVEAPPDVPVPSSAGPLVAAPSLLSSQGLVAAAKGLFHAAGAALGRAPKNAAVDSFGRDEALVERLRPLTDALYERYWRVTVEGASQVPLGPSILVANHAGAVPIDGPLLHHALRRERPDIAPARWLLEDQVFHAPGLGVLWNRLGAVRASPENAQQLLANGTPIIVFPEGFQGLSKPFAERYRLQRFGRGGYVKIAARAQVPIVPVAIVGSEESSPLLAKLPGGALGLPFVPVTLPPLPARWFIKFGEPVLVERSVADDAAAVQRLNDQTRETIDSMLQVLLASRGAVF